MDAHADSPDDDILLLEDDATSPAIQAYQPAWQILIVDDDQDVHDTTRFALQGMNILGRPLQLTHAYSASEALACLTTHPDIAVILLDVVMETEDAGLRIVETIRNELKLETTRIILRTGQPGQAPEAETITRYDINDYKNKSELNQHKLFTALTASLRSYNQLLQLDASRRGLEKIVSASNLFIAEQGLQAFAEGVITQIAGLIGVSPDGLVCAAAEDNGDPTSAPSYTVIAAAGHLHHLMQRQLTEIEDTHIATALQRALQEQRTLIGINNVTLYFRKGPSSGFAAFIESNTPIKPIDQHLLEVFCTNIAVCAKNIDLVSELRRDAFVDRQLGCPNRTAMLSMLNQGMQNKRSGGGFALIDIDHFAATNDLLGHAAGDELLLQILGRLKSAFPPDTYIARLSGDAFGLLVHADTISMHSIQAALAMPFMLDGTAHSITACAGIVDAPFAHTSGEDVLKNAYLALRDAKQQGAGQAQKYTQHIAEASLVTAHMLKDLRSGFDNDELFVVFQPQVDLANTRVIGAEALLRWRRADGKMVPPDQFIPVAEQSGLIVGIGEWMMITALQALHRFRLQARHSMRMAVNVSVVQLRQANFEDIVLRALKQTDTHPNHLELEITESVGLYGMDEVTPLLERLRQHGIAISIDDFGTGYSSLSYLSNLPADNVKVDRSFISTLLEGGKGARIARSIIRLDNELGMKTVAEGVENKATEDELIALGCEMAQGYYYSKPMPVDEFCAWLLAYEHPEQAQPR